MDQDRCIIVNNLKVSGMDAYNPTKVNKMNKFLGYKIEIINGNHVFSDTGKLVSETYTDRPCGYCGVNKTLDGHDYCIRDLPGVMNACCGHGSINEAYIQFNNGDRISGENVFNWLQTTNKISCK